MTDVNIAASMLVDAFEHKADSFVLVSGDSETICGSATETAATGGAVSCGASIDGVGSVMSAAGTVGVNAPRLSGSGDFW